MAVTRQRIPKGWSQGSESPGPSQGQPDVVVVVVVIVLIVVIISTGRLRAGRLRAAISQAGTTHKFLLAELFSGMYQKRQSQRYVGTRQLRTLRGKHQGGTQGGKGPVLMCHPGNSEAALLSLSQLPFPEMKYSRLGSNPYDPR